MLEAAAIIMASAGTARNNYGLFSGEIGTAGMIVIGVLIGALVLCIALAVIGFCRDRHFRRLPTILGHPKQLLEQVGAQIDLTMSEKHLLNKLANRLLLPQPVSILISPELMIQAARAWQQGHQLIHSKQWGINRLNDLSKRIYHCDLRELARRKNQQ